MLPVPASALSVASAPVVLGAGLVALLVGSVALAALASFDRLIGGTVVQGLFAEIAGRFAEIARDFLGLC